MKHRKPRYAQYELDRMKIRDLSALCTRLKLSTKSAVEKSDLIRAICNSGKVDMIVAPKPVEYKISDLRHMGVGSLKRAMGDAGVFFDAKDVLEKEDMVMIFVNSGRVALIAEDDVPVTSEEDISYRDLERQEDNEEVVPNNKRPRNMCTDDENSMNQTTSTGTSLVESVVYNDSETTDDDINRVSAECETVHIQDNNPYGVNNNQQFDHTNPEESRNADSSDVHSTNYASHYSNDNLNNRSEFTARSIAELRRLAYELQVDISDCIEKKEMIERLAARASGSGR